MAERRLMQQRIDEIENLFQLLLLPLLLLLLPLLLPKMTVVLAPMNVTATTEQQRRYPVQPMRT